MPAIVAWKIQGERLLEGWEILTWSKVSLLFISITTSNLLKIQALLVKKYTMKSLQEFDWNKKFAYQVLSNIWNIYTRAKVALFRAVDSQCSCLFGKVGTRMALQVAECRLIWAERGSFGNLLSAGRSKFYFGKLSDYRSWFSRQRAARWLKSGRRRASSNWSRSRSPVIDKWRGLTWRQRERRPPACRCARADIPMPRRSIAAGTRVLGIRRFNQTRYDLSVLSLSLSTLLYPSLYLYLHRSLCLLYMYVCVRVRAAVRQSSKNCC